VDPKPRPEPAPAYPDAERAHPGALIRADALLAELGAALADRPLQDHVEAFGLVHQSLVDALAQTEG
jgi:hypothetical protein